MEWNFTHVVPIFVEIPDELRGSDIYTRGIADRKWLDEQVAILRRK
jgi:hypothetical protein